MGLRNCYLVRFSERLTQEEVSAFCKKIENDCFMILPNKFGNRQVEFVTRENDYHTVDSIRERYDLPDDCEVVDTSEWFH